MVTVESVEKQLKKLKFNVHGWGQSEARELPNILLEDEEIYEVVNGYYEAGFALLVGTNVRILLVDKKPMNYLTVEDLRFDMINEIDYSHRLLGAHISVSAGSKTLKFTSINQARLRKLITHVQHCMAEMKKKQTDHAVDQKQHLEQINQQLQAYLLAQHQQTQQLQRQMAGGGGQQQAATMPDPIKPSPELNDFLFAQSLLAQHKANEARQKYQDASGDSGLQQGATADRIAASPKPDQMRAPEPQAALPPVAKSSLADASTAMADLYAEGLQEIYGKRQQQSATTATQPAPAAMSQPPAVSARTPTAAASSSVSLLDVNPLKIAYSKLPMALRNKRFGRPSFHSHSQATDVATRQPITEV